MSGVLTTYAITHAVLESPTDRLILIILAHKATDDGFLTISYKELKSLALIQHTTTVSNSLQRLERKGLIKIIKTRDAAQRFETRSYQLFPNINLDCLMKEKVL